MEKKIVKIAKTMTTDKKQIFDQKSSPGPSAKRKAYNNKIKLNLTTKKQQPPDPGIPLSPVTGPLVVLQHTCKFTTADF